MKKFAFGDTALQITPDQSIMVS